MFCESNHGRPLETGAIDTTGTFSTFGIFRIVKGNLDRED